MILAAIALGILLIGCINFMNLSIARSSNRAKEMGLRKSVGAYRSQLAIQLVGESMLLAFIALLFALLIVDIALPTFNNVTGKNIGILSLFTGGSLPILVLSSLATGFFSGFYPAMTLANYKVRDAFSGKLSLGGNNTFTKSLVVLQFTITTVLIVSMLVMSSQMNFIKNKDLGFNSSQIVVVPNIEINGTSMYSYLQDALRNNSDIQTISSASQNFGDPDGLGGRGFEYRGKPMRVGVISVDEKYIETLGIKVIDGRSFNPDLASDLSKAVIVNEACFRDFELTLNEPFEDYARNPEDNPIVIGVMNDFHYGSLNTIVYPMLIKLSDKKDLGHIFISLSGNDITNSISSIQEAWQSFSGDLPFEYAFMDDTLAAQYTSERKWQQIIQASVVTAILLSCFGLFGLVAMAISYKKAEISIRKVLGAQLYNLVGLYSWKYTQLVVLAFFISIPISYFFLQQWLETFEYRITIDVQVYALAGFLTASVAFLTIIYKIVEAAIANPAKVLRDQ
jgi:putative ABC transport system permease protein